MKAPLRLLGLLSALFGTPVAGQSPMPMAGADFQWQLTGDLILSVDTAVFDLDMFEADAATIGLLRDRGVYVICYVSVGTVEDWRPDAGAFPPAIVGEEYDGWPGESWLDIRDRQFLPAILEARLDMAAAKGCQGIEPDNLDGYESGSGFPMDAADAMTFLRWLADAAHDRGLTIGLKNMPEFAADLAGTFDWVLTEDCAIEGWCGAFEPFLASGKPVFHVLYTDTEVDFAGICARSATGATYILKNRDLDAWRRTC